MTAPKKDPFSSKTAAETKADAQAAEKQSAAEDKVIEAKAESTSTPAEEAKAASTNPVLNARDADKVESVSTTQEVVKRSQTEGGEKTSKNTADATQAPEGKTKTKKAAKTASAAKQIKREDLPVTIPTPVKDGTYFATVQNKLGHNMVSVRAELWVGEAPLNVSLEEAEEIHQLLGEVIARTKDLAK